MILYRLVMMNFSWFLKHKKRLTLILAGLSGSLVIIVFVFFLLKPAASVTSPIPGTVLSELDTNVIPSLPTVPEDLKTLDIVLMGYGGAGHDGGYLIDAIQLLHIDFEKAKILLISIPRDLWVKTPGGQETKINAVVINSSYKNDKTNLIGSGAQSLKKVLTEITGLPANYFIGVDFVGFQRAIGINLKGIEVDVGETLDDPWYPIKGEELNPCGKTSQEIASLSAKLTGFELERQFPCRYKHLLFKKGLVHMEGGDALEYVRSRHGSNEGDISRGRRQQEVLTAIRKKLFSISTLENLPVFFSEAVKNTTTDITPDIAKYLVPALKKSQEFTIKSINLSTTNVLANSSSRAGGFILVPKAGAHKWDQVREFISGEIAR